MRRASELFRKNVVRLLNETGWSQAALARKLKLAPTAVNRWISGEVVPGIEAIEAIADVFGLSAAELMSTAEVKPRMAELSAEQMLDRLKEHFTLQGFELERLQREVAALKQQLQDAKSPDAKIAENEELRLLRIMVRSRDKSLESLKSENSALASEVLALRNERDSKPTKHPLLSGETKILSKELSERLTKLESICANQEQLGALDEFLVGISREPLSKSSSRSKKPNTNTR